MKIALLYTVLATFFHVSVDPSYNSEYRLVKDCPYVVRILCSILYESREYGGGYEVSQLRECFDLAEKLRTSREKFIPSIPAQLNYQRVNDVEYCGDFYKKVDDDEYCGGYYEKVKDGECCEDFYEKVDDDEYCGDYYEKVNDDEYCSNFYFESNVSLLCSAAILSDYWVISAAHCAEFPMVLTLQVRIGSSLSALNGVLVDIDKIFVHGDYDPDFADDSDIALIKLKTPIAFNEYQQPIQITKESPKIGDDIIVLGFGSHHHLHPSSGLKSARTSVIDDEVCCKSYKSKFSKNMICTSTVNVDLCGGDSGGPAAVHNGKLIGINAQGCEYNGSTIEPNILTKVPNYYDWILQTTEIQYIDE